MRSPDKSLHERNKHCAILVGVAKEVFHLFTEGGGTMPTAPALESLELAIETARSANYVKEKEYGGDVFFSHSLEHYKEFQRMYPTDAEPNGFKPGAFAEALDNLQEMKQELGYMD